MDAKTEILTRIRNAHQLSNMPKDVEIVRTYNMNKTEEYSREQLKEMRVGGQAFAVCQHAGDFAQFLRALFGDLDQAGAFLEVVSAQRRGEAGGAAGGQDVVGAGAVGPSSNESYVMMM